MLIREMWPEEKPRERFKESAGDVSITDLIAILIRTGRKNHSVREVASDVVSFLEENCGEAWIEEPYWKDLTDIPGIGADKAVTICAAIELGRRLAGRLRHESQEHLYACYVNTKNRLMGKKEIGRGNMNAAPADIKEIMRWAIRLKARGIILVHNHPSGFPDPSVSDIQLTKKVARACALMDFDLLDHIIIGDGVFASLQEKGLM